MKLLLLRLLSIGLLPLLSTCLLVYSSTVVKAASEPVTFTITPAITDRHVKPGDTFTLTLRLTNKSNIPQALRAYTKNFAANGLEGGITFGDDNITSYTASTWISLDQPSLVLPPDGHQDIAATVTVPKNAEPGGHYASILFEQMIQNLPSETSHVQVAARLTSLLFLTVDGDVIEAGQILGATPGSQCSAVVCGFKAPRFLDKGPVPFSFIFNNTGNVHVRPKATITIFQNNKQVAKLDLDDRAVLPNSQRLFEAKWDRVVLSGHYTAKLHLVYGSKNYSLDATTSFWAFPWQAVLIIAILAVGAYGVFLSRKYFHIKRLHHKTQD